MLIIHLIFRCLFPKVQMFIHRNLAAWFWVKKTAAEFRGIKTAAHLEKNCWVLLREKGCTIGKTGADRVAEKKKKTGKEKWFFLSIFSQFFFLFYIIQIEIFFKVYFGYSRDVVVKIVISQFSSNWYFVVRLFVVLEVDCC